MSKREIIKTAKEIIEGSLGLKISSNDIILLEGSDDSNKVNYILFYRFGFPNIQYRSFYNQNKNKYELTIYNKDTDNELTIF